MDGNCQTPLKSKKGSREETVTIVVTSEVGNLLNPELAAQGIRGYRPTLVEGKYKGEETTIFYAGKKIPWIVVYNEDGKPFWGKAESAWKVDFKTGAAAMRRVKK